MRSVRRYIRLLTTYLRPQWQRTAALAFFLLGSIGLQLVNPQVLRYFIDRALAGAEAETLAGAAVLFIGIALVNQGLAASAQYLGESAGWTATNALRADLMLHCLRLDLSFHKARTPGELIERIDGDVSSLTSFFSRFMVNVVGNVLLLVGVLVVVMLEDWRAGLAMAAFAALALGVLTRLRGIAVPYWAEVREAAAQLYGFLGEHLAGTEDVRASGATGFVLTGLSRHHLAWLRSRKRSNMAVIALVSTTIITFAAGNALTFAVSGYLLSIGAITIGTVYLLFHYMELLRRPIEQLRQELQEVQRAVASAGRVEALLEVEARIRDREGKPLPAGALAVEFDGVTFAYEDETKEEGRRTKAQRPDPSFVRSLPSGGAKGPSSDHVLRDVSFSLAPGRVLGLLGRTGSGKTTLARLLLRFYDPTAGTIRLAGGDLRDATIDDVRQRVSIVTQDVQLFQASVRDNLTFFDRSVADRQVVAVLDEVGLGPWFRALPAGLDTAIAGGGLSAGEAQLLALARVFLRDPGLVVLDEASSRLDPATERLIERAIDRLLAGRTGIVIAHRLATVQRVDDVLILDSGSIVEYGARPTLVADPQSRFSTLLRTGLEAVLA